MHPGAYVDLETDNDICSDWCLRMDAAMEVNFQNNDDEEAELEREELQRQNEVK